MDPLKRPKHYFIGFSLWVVLHCPLNSFYSIWICSILSKLQTLFPASALGGGRMKTGILVFSLLILQAPNETDIVINAWREWGNEDWLDYSLLDPLTFCTFANPYHRTDILVRKIKLLAKQQEVCFVDKHSPEVAVPGRFFTMIQRSDDFIFMKSYRDFKT